jgi:hypothetical protein
MKNRTTDDHFMDTPRSRRPMTSASFLVRCWLEPRELEGARPAVRITLRDLETGEERALTDPRQLGDRIASRLLSLEAFAASDEAEEEEARRG